MPGEIYARKIRGAKLYVDPRLRDAGRPAAIASQPIARWFGEWVHDVQQEVDQLVAAAAEQQSLAQLVVYKLPARDSGGYSAGGLGSSAAYRAWVDKLATGIGQRQAIIILEPDALPQLPTLRPDGQRKRLADLAYAVHVLSSRTRAFIYIDAGHASWDSVKTMMPDWLRKAGVGKARGFSLNVSNFQRTDDSTVYGDFLSRKLGGTHYVIDTSRNGKGPPPDEGEWWINPPGRGLGPVPTTTPPLGDFADAYLWIKTPGESDGAARGAPPAGEWFEAYAQELITNDTSIAAY